MSRAMGLGIGLGEQYFWRSDVLNILKPGQGVKVRWRGATGVVAAQMARLYLFPTEVESSCWVTFIDSAGVSVYISRHGRRSDIEAFLENKIVAWQAYFEPLNLFNQGYAGSRHFTRRFPIDCQ